MQTAILASYSKLIKYRAVLAREKESDVIQISQFAIGYCSTIV